MKTTMRVLEASVGRHSTPTVPAMPVGSRRLVPQFFSKFHYAKRRFPVTLKCRQMHEVLNVDEIKN
jgi:hypothetical protein